MSLRRVAYLLLILVIAGASALVGAAAGGFAVYRAVQGQPNNLPAPIQEILPANNTNPGQTLTLNNTDVETAITKSVQKVSPAVVTVVGTIPGLEGFYVAVSHSGVTLGPLWGRIAAAEVLDGVRDARLAPYRPERFL